MQPIIARLSLMAVASTFASLDGILKYLGIIPPPGLADIVTTTSQWAIPIAIVGIILLLARAMEPVGNGLIVAGRSILVAEKWIDIVIAGVFRDIGRVVQALGRGITRLGKLISRKPPGL